MDDKLLEALEIIKEECRKHQDCKTCPMRNVHNGCGVDDSSPSDWRLVPHTVYF